MEQIVAAPVPRIREETGQVIQLIPQDRISDRNGEQVIDIPIPQIQVEIVGIMLILQERISERIGTTLSSRIQEKLFEVMQLIRQERISWRIVEKSVDVPVSQIQERPVEGAKGIPRERVDIQTKVPAIHFAEKTVDIPHKQVTSRGVDRLVVVQHEVHMFEEGQVTPDAPQIEVSFNIDAKEILNVSVQEKSTSRSKQTTSTNEKGRWPQTVIDCMEAERCQDEGEANKAKIDNKNDMEKCCVTMRNAAVEGKPRFKLEAGVRENRKICAGCREAVGQEPVGRER